MPNVSDLLAFKQSQRSKAGKSLQSIIEDTNDRYQVDGLALAMTINTGFVPSGVRHPKTKQMLYIHGKKVWADVTGCVAHSETKTGFMFVAELKNRITASQSRRTYEVRSLLEDHQAAVLDMVAKMGHRGMLVLWAQFKGMDQPVMANLNWPFPQERIDAESLKQNEIPIKHGVFDYLRLYE